MPRLLELTCAASLITAVPTTPQRPDAGIAAPATPEPPIFDLNSLKQSLPEDRYRLPDSPIRRQKEEHLWVSYLTQHPNVWLGGLKKDIKADLEAVLPDGHHHILNDRQAPTQEFITNELLPLWVTETGADTVSADTLDVAADDESVEVDELFEAKKWIAAQFLAYKNPETDVRHQFAAVCRKLPLPITYDARSSHILAGRPLLYLIDSKPRAPASGTKDVDIMSEVTSLWSNVEEDPNGEFTNAETILEAVDWAAVAEEQGKLAKNDSRFTYQKELPATTRGSPTKNGFIFRTKVNLTLASSALYIRRAIMLTTPRTFSPEIHKPLDRNLTAITPQIELLVDVDQFLTRENEERLRLIKAGKPVGPLLLYAQLKEYFQKYNGIGYNIFALEPSPDAPRAFVDNHNEVFYSAKQPDGLYRNPNTGEVAPLFYFTRLSPHWQHWPNPFLFIINAAAKLVHHPDRPIPIVIRQNMLLCLQIVVRLFSVPCTTLPLLATQTDITAVARQNLRLTQALATPAGKKN
ncbi:hypothetical protein JCM10296v2_003933 [Rhodotorula toruloides]